MNNIDENTLEKLRETFEKFQEELGVKYDENNDDFLTQEMEDLTGISFDDLDDKLQNFMNIKEIRVKKLNKDAITPSYNYGSDSGFDLFSTVDVEIAGLGRALIPTGLAFQFDEGYEIQVRSKSGLAINQGLMTLNSPGTVDQGYSGEIKVILYNTNPHPVKINKGMKIAQAVLCPVVNGKNVKFELVKDFEETDRGDKGFGSTGI